MSQHEPELRLLAGQHPMLQQPRPWRAAAGSALAHLLLGVVVVAVPAGAPRIRDAAVITAELGDPTLLVAPPAERGEREPGEAAGRAEVSLEELLSRRKAAEQVEAPKPEPLVEAPKIDYAELARSLPPLARPPALEAGPPPVTAPPEIQVEEKPKIVFEDVGARPELVAPGRGGLEVPMVPNTPVREMGSIMARGGVGTGLVVGDLGDWSGGIGSALGSGGLRQASNVELLSDPMGVDFRPYLIRILSMVRRNWFAVIPESARLGRRGRVQIQFAINRDGSVPKLVIALPSGTESLDRAAVVGVSASNPFPPLPAEYKGEQVRLQFTFLYNIPAR